CEGAAGRHADAAQPRRSLCRCVCRRLFHAGLAVRRGPAAVPARADRAGPGGLPGRQPAPGGGGATAPAGPRVDRAGAAPVGNPRWRVLTGAPVRITLAWTP